MHKLLEKLFASEGMTRYPVTDLELYKYSSPGKTNYWLIIHDEPLIAPDRQAGWLNECKSATADPALEKNINLLIVWRTDSASAFSSKEVHHAEEDSYFFKKHVLPYTNEELDGLQQQIVTQGLRQFSARPSRLRLLLSSINHTTLREAGKACCTGLQ